MGACWPLPAATTRRGCGGWFVAARDRLVRRLGAAGDTPAAPRLAVLRWPTVSVGAANQLAGAAPNALELQATATVAAEPASRPDRRVDRPVGSHDREAAPAGLRPGFGPK